MPTLISIPVVSIFTVILNDYNVGHQLPEAQCAAEGSNKMTNFVGRNEMFVSEPKIQMTFVLQMLSFS